MKHMQKRLDLTDVLLSLMEKSGQVWGFTVTGDDLPRSPEQYYSMVTFDRGDRPSWLQVEDEISALEEKAKLEQYKLDRLNAYPDLAEQLDLLWHSINEGTLDKTSAFYTTIKEVKESNPKPQGV